MNIHIPSVENGELLFYIFMQLTIFYTITASDTNTLKQQQAVLYR